VEFLCFTINDSPSPAGIHLPDFVHMWMSSKLSLSQVPMEIEKLLLSNFVSAGQLPALGGARELLTCMVSSESTWH
jgi:hypothetical protein